MFLSRVLLRRANIVSGVVGKEEEDLCEIGRRSCGERIIYITLLFSEARAI